MTRTRVAVAAAALVIAGGGLVGTGMVAAAPASAQGCVGQNVVVAGHGGGRCDHPPGPDGSFTRCDTVYVFGIGGTNCYQVPPGTP